MLTSSENFFSLTIPLIKNTLPKIKCIALLSANSGVKSLEFSVTSEKKEGLKVKSFDSHHLCEFDLTKEMTLDPDLMDEEDLASPRDHVPVFYRFQCKLNQAISEQSAFDIHKLDLAWGNSL